MDVVRNMTTKEKIQALLTLLDDVIKKDEARTQGEWDADDPYDSYCGNPYCTVDGCPENHPSGKQILSGPETEGFSDAELRMHPRDTRFIASASVSHGRNAKALKTMLEPCLDARDITGHGRFDEILSPILSCYPDEILQRYLK